MAVCQEASITGSVLQVICHCWGDDVAALLPAPDIITGADIVYQQEHFDALITTLQDLAAPHTLIFLAYKLRGEHSCLHLSMVSTSAACMFITCCLHTSKLSNCVCMAGSQALRSLSRSLFRVNCPCLGRIVWANLAATVCTWHECLA